MLQVDQFVHWAQGLGWHLPIDFPHQQSRAATQSTDRERDTLIKQIGAMALVAAERSGRYQRGGLPNASAIAEAVGALVQAMPDANAHGLSSASIRKNIGDGLGLLKK